MLLCESGAVDEKVLDDMLKSSKQMYVDKHHSREIFQITTGKMAGYWKTYLGSERKQVVRRNYDDLLDVVYEYYRFQERDYSTIFKEWLNYHSRKANLSPRSYRDYEDLYRILGVDIGSKKITAITDEDIENIIIRAASSGSIGSARLKRAFSVVRNVFAYAKRHRYVQEDPTELIDIEVYFKDCRSSRKRSDTDKEFTPDELQLIRWDILSSKHAQALPTALMALLASYTGMRAGELPALRWSDIVTDRDGQQYIHIHRQQSLCDSTYTELPYTKDERRDPHGGRYFPITPLIQDILNLIRDRLGECDEGFIFHDHGTWIKKDTYEQNLSRRCERLGITKGNNHAFRMALNSQLIDLGLSSAERAVLLGHTVRTNEQVYSLAGTHRVRRLAAKLTDSTTYSHLLTQKEMQAV